MESLDIVLLNNIFMRPSIILYIPKLLQRKYDFMITFDLEQKQEQN